MQISVPKRTVGRSHLIIFFLFSFFCVDLLANNDDSPSQGDIWYKKVGSQMATGNLDSAIVYLDWAKEAFEKEDNWEGVFKSMQGLCIVSWRKGDFENAYRYLEEMIPITKEHNQGADDEKGMLGRIYGYKAVFKADQGFYDESITAYEMAIDQIKSMEEKDTVALATQWNNLANVHSDRGDYEKAEDCFERSLSILGEEVRLDIQASVYNNLGQIKYRLESYHEAKIRFKRAYQLYEAYAQISGSKNFSSTGNFVITCNNLGKTYLQLNQLDSTAKYLRLAQRTQKEKKIKRQLPLTNLFLGQLYLKQGNAQSGIASLQEGLNQALDQFDLPNTYVARCYFSLAEAYQSQGEIDKALDLFLKSSEALVHEPLKDGLPVQMDDVASKMELLKTLRAKASLLWASYQKTGDTDLLEAAFRHYTFIDALIVSARQSYLEENSKLYLAEKSHEIFGQAIRVALSLYEKTQKASYFEAVFQFMESNKAASLLESLADDEARLFARLNSSETGRKLISEEENLKREIAGYQRMIYEANNKESEKVAQIEENLFEQKQALEEIQQALFDKFPEYYKLKAETRLTSIKKLQEEILAEEEVLLEYYLDEEGLVTLMVGRDFANVQETKFGNDDREMLAVFIQQISSFDFSSKPELAFQTFTQSAFGAYQLLLKPYTEQASTQHEKLIIIPDGLLNFVSFQALIRELPESKTVDYSPNNLAYLLEDFQIRYAYSANQLAFFKKKDQRSESKSGFVGFAPYFGEGSANATRRSCEAAVLAPLSENVNEVNEIAALIKGKTYTGTAASTEAFKAVAKDYGILHLATHACSQADEALYQKIFFGQEDYLYAFDLYDLNISADLVVLSACETGIGQLVEGEGVLSLARGFAYAGSRSILTTLWSVSDRSTADIMVEYYKQLQAGMAKSVALRKAQLTYLEGQKPNLMHPVYWAGFMQVGLDDAIQFKSGGLLFRAFLLCGALLIGLLLFLRRRNQA